ncbi:hypothetical protein SAMN05216178_6911 [Pseudomonas saponiphila]|jgi:hypothetical protein|uniref:Lipoprotein n=1 Tax=Pseudomonas saponiphila TaxID=556534 RepID=A0A1H5A126_9PSED|nr:hypothetical protein [Pseudomonas saponiphila]SED35454.1 hypothetical protein SAMN05216178_6911 [Pseudomonas saponiphila]
MKRIAIALAALSLAGCDAIFNPVNDYKQTCFGNFTNECEDMLVDANLFLIEKFIEDVESKEDDLTALYGAEGYASIFKLTDYLVAKQEELRPGFFARNFFGEAQPFRGPRNALMSGAEFRAIEEAVEERFGKKNSAPVAEESAPDPEIAPEAEYQAEPEPEPQPVEEPADPSTADAGASTLEEAIAQYVEQDPDRNGGAEYLDARSTIEADFTGEGMPDVAVLYTIEGAGGSNSSFQKLALFEGMPDGRYRPLTSTILPGSISGLQVVVEDGRSFMGVATLTHSPDDPDCCPSVESLVKYRFDVTGVLVSVTPEQ